DGIGVLSSLQPHRRIHIEPLREVPDHGYFQPCIRIPYKRVQHIEQFRLLSSRHIVHIIKEYIQPLPCDFSEPLNERLDRRNQTMEAVRRDVVLAQETFDLIPNVGSRIDEERKLLLLAQYRQ